MASLTVGNVVFHFATVRTESYSAKPVTDPSGRHFEMTQIDLEISAIVNRVAVATRKPLPTPVGPGNAGNNMPLTVYELQKYLTVPGRPVSYSVGGTTILDAPAVDRDTGARFERDPKGGPFPRHARFVQFTGDETAVLEFSVTAFESRSPNVLLSNAWDLVSAVDDCGFTTRKVSGRAAFRKDFLDAKALQPEDFRSVLVPACPPGMRRVAVEVFQGRTADEVEYAAVDQENVFDLGVGEKDAVKVRGSVTATTHTPIHDLKSALKMAADMAGKAVSMDVGGFASSFIGYFVPTREAKGIARVYGRKGCDRSKLASLGVSFILDRLGPINSLNSVTAASVSHNFDSDGPDGVWAEVRLDLFVADVATGVYTLTRKDKTFNLGDVYQDELKRVIGSPTGGTRPLNSSGTRGTWLKRLVSQRLQPASGADANSLPDNPPGGSAARDVPRPL